MAICNNKKCSPGECNQTETCVAYVPVITNADRIRAMSDEEIAEYVCRNSINTLCDIICGGECNAIATLKKSGDWACKENVMKWLQQPAEED